MPDSYMSDALPVTVSQADGFVVVTFRNGDDLVRETYDYDHCRTLNDALDSYREYEDGQYERSEAVGIFPVKNGLPLGSKLDPALMMRLMAEARSTS